MKASRVLWMVALAAVPARAQDLQIAADEPEHGAVAKAEIRVPCPLVAPGCEHSASQQVTSMFGLRGSETAIHGEDTKAGLSLSSTALGHLQDAGQHVSGRVGHFAFIGGGRGGIEGGIGVDLALGLYQALGEGHGPFTRLGLRAELLGNAAFYSSMLELPQVQLGYGAMGRTTFFELAARAGPVLTGRYKPMGARRKLGGAFELGGVGSLRLGPIVTDFEWARIEVRDSLSQRPVDAMRVSLCGGAEWALGACFDLRMLNGDVDDGGPREMRTWYLGVSVGAFVHEPPRVR